MVVELEGEIGMSKLIFKFLNRTVPICKIEAPFLDEI